MSKKQLIVLYCMAFLFVFGQEVFAQDRGGIRAGRLILQVEDAGNIESILAEANQGERSPIFTLEKVISPRKNLCLISFYNRRIRTEDALIVFEKIPSVIRVQTDRLIDKRELEPNDPLFDSQWALTAIGAPSAWEIASDGVTALGDTIVMAIVDDGFRMSHEDLLPNFWRNHNEIPGDGIDNDGNGYIDDYLGWSVPNQSDEHVVGNHGASVAGLAGAKGDNSMGIAGVSWNAKLMIISGAGFESEVIESYEYMIEMRRLYNQTNGAKGAFIVSSNSSFGINGGKAEDFQIWCELYDDMADVGILPVGATSNGLIDVEEQGDIPSDCPSNALLMLTNVNEQGVLQAGYSDSLIDMAAPGTSTLTTSGTNFYLPFGGTSASAPHATGAVALLYAYPNADFAARLKEDPYAAVYEMKDVLMRNTTSLSELDGKTITGGQLDIGKAMTEIDAYYHPVEGPLDFWLSPNPSSGNFSLNYTVPDQEEFVVEIYNMIGQLIYDEAVFPPSIGYRVHSIDLDWIRQGLYVVSMKSGEAQISRLLSIH